MVKIYFVLAGVCTILWVPILLRFYRSWLARGNPISLAICAAILLLMWLSVAGSWIATGGVNACTGMIVSTALSAAVALYAHLAFYWSSKNFPSSRNKE